MVLLASLRCRCRALVIVLSPLALGLLAALHPPPRRARTRESLFLAEGAPPSLPPSACHQIVNSNPMSRSQSRTKGHPARRYAP